MTASSAEIRRHRHGRWAHAHAHVGPHRHRLLGRRLSEPIAPADGGPPEDDHGHSHGLIDDRISRSRGGIQAVARSLAVLGLAALAQTAIFVLASVRFKAEEVMR